MSAKSETLSRIENELSTPVVLKGRAAPRWALTERMQFYDVPGVSLAVIQHWRTEWARAYGVTTGINGTPLTPDTLFQACSISKPLSALGAMLLSERGLIDLDQEVNHKLVSWKIPENELTRSVPVTLRHLLTHTSGITAHPFRGYPIGGPIPTLLQILNGEPPAYPLPLTVTVKPGSEWHYTTGGYEVIEQLVVDLTNTLFEDFMDQEVLEPLGMNRSTYRTLMPSKDGTTPAKAHDARGEPVEGGWEIYPQKAGGGLWATPTDLARFASTLARAACREQIPVIPSQIALQMLSRFAKVPAGAFDGMGLGLFLGNRGGRSYFQHGGSNSGYKCLMLASVESGDGAVVMTNGDNGSFLMNEIVESIAHVCGWQGWHPLAQRPVEVSFSVVAPFLGEYGTGDQIFQVTAESDSLWLTFPSGHRTELYPASESEFFTTISDTRIRFQRNANGQVSLLHYGIAAFQRL